MTRDGDGSGRPLRSHAVESVIALEDLGPEQLHTRLPGAQWHAWPLVRWPLVTAAVDSELETHAPVGGSAGVRQRMTSMRRALMTGGRGMHRLPRRRVLFIVGGGTVHRADGALENWLVHGYAAGAAGESLTVVDNPLTSPWRRGDRFSDETRTTSAELVRIELARIVRRSSPAVVEAANHAVAELTAVFERQLGRPLDPAVRAPAVRRLLLAEHRLELMKRVAGEVDPTAVVIEDASYGSRSPFVEWLCGQGVRVIEPQHGWIGPTHGAYNFGRVMHSGALRESLPGELALFGSFWGRGLLHPAAMPVIGKTHLQDAAAAAPPRDKRPPHAMVVSSVYRRDDTMALVLRMRELLPPEWTVGFRPHPSERRDTEALYPRLVDEDRISIDREPDVYRSMRRSRLVVGTASTVLFEALAFDLDVLVIDTPLTAMYAPRDVFGPAIATNEALGAAVRQVVAGTRPRSDRPIDDIWAPDAAARAAAYIAAI